MRKIFDYKKQRNKYKDVPSDSSHRRLWIPDISWNVKWQMAADILGISRTAFVVATMDQVSDSIIKEAEGKDE